MTKSHRLLAVGTTVAALAVTPIAAGQSGTSVTTTPKRAKEGKTVEMLVRGMRPNERVKAVESAPFGQKRTLYPRAGRSGSLLVRVRAQIKGKHSWTFTGRRSKRKASTSYRVV
jgi:hypothetical protein